MFKLEDLIANHVRQIVLTHIENISFSSAFEEFEGGDLFPFAQIIQSKGLVVSSHIEKQNVSVLALYGGELRLDILRWN